MPSNEVGEKFEELQDTISDEEDDIMHDWLDYFQRNWVGPLCRNLRRQPRFPMAWWECHQCVIEGWHHSFNMRVGCTHPSLRRLTEKLRKEQASNELVMEQFRAGMPLPPQKKKNQDLVDRVLRIVQNYGTYQAPTNFYEQLHIIID